MINKRAGGTGLISGRKAFQRPMKEGVGLLNAIQDVYLTQRDHDRVRRPVRLSRNSSSASFVLLNASSSHGIRSGSNSCASSPSSSQPRQPPIDRGRERDDDHRDARDTNRC